MDALLNNIQSNIMIAIAVGGVMIALTKLLGTWAQHKIYARVQPILPLVLASAGAWFAIDGSPVSRIALGICLGAISSAAYKIFQQSFKGRDKRIGS